MRFPVKKTTFSRHGGKLKPSPLQPVLPLLPEVLLTKDQDKSKFINFELKSRASQPAGLTTYKKFVRVFEKGSPQQWINLIQDLEEVWMQNSVNGPSNCTSTIHALLKGESLTAFETALEDVCVDPDRNVNTLQALIIKHIGRTMDQESNSVFPHCPLEIQLWMVRGMKKPYNLLTCKTTAAIRRSTIAFPSFHLDRLLPNSQTKRLWVSSDGCFCQPGGRSSTLIGMSPLSEQRPSSSLNARPSNESKASRRKRGRTKTTTTTSSKKQVWKFRGKSSKK
jgi:hypothetical protein